MNIFEYPFSFSQEDVDNFAKITGDDNPIHINESAAAKSIFKKRIMHGFLSGSVFSRIFGTMWPGNGTIYLSQNMKFLKPMYAGQEYLAKLEVTKLLPNNTILVRTAVVNKNGATTIEGEAIIKPSKKPF